MSYHLDQERTKACFTLAGSLHIVDLTSGAVTTPQIGGQGEALAFDPRFSPDASMISYVSGNDLRLIHLEQDQDQLLLKSNDPAISYGRADFIAAEEIGRSRGHWWTGDGADLIVAKVDENPVNEWWISDPAHPDRPPTPVRYPAAGTANAIVELIIIANPYTDNDPAPRSVPWDDASSYEYLADVICPHDGDPLLVRQTRDQTEVSICRIDTANPNPGLSLVHRINDDAWVPLIATSPTPIPDGVLTIEDVPDEASPDRPVPGPGRRALTINGNPVTGEGLAVRSIEAIVGTSALVTAWTVPSEIHLFLVPITTNSGFTGIRPPTQLTTEPGVHTVSDVWLSPEGAQGEAEAMVVVASANPESEHTDISVFGVVDETGSAILGPARARVADRSTPPALKALPVFHPLGADRLESAVFFPTDYDGESLLPVLLDPYGGPGAQRALKNYRPHLVSQWFADHGFVVIVADGRGTPGRNPRWERQIWGDVADPVLEDQLVALDSAASEFDVLDLSRVGIRGWSFGGYLAALAVLRRPDRFHAAIAGAPVTDWRLYDTHYTERYLGHPDISPINYQRTDLLADAANLKRPLMLIHGLADDNVVAAHTLQLSTALLAAGRPHRVLPLTGVTHMTPQETVAENLLKVQLAFLQEMLQGQPMMASSEQPLDPFVTSEPPGQLAGAWGRTGGAQTRP